MVRDAAEHADEDKQRREEVETRNQAEALSFQAERTLKDLGDKVSSEDKLEVENQVSSLREALKGSDIEPIQLRHDGACRDAAAHLHRRLPGVRVRGWPDERVRRGRGRLELDRRGHRRAGPRRGAGGARDEGEGEEAVEGEFKEV